MDAISPVAEAIRPQGGAAAAAPSAIAQASRREPTELPSFETLNQFARAMTARVTQGISPHAQIAAWTDWISHVSRAPGRQLELGLRAMVASARLARFAWHLGTGREAEIPYPPQA